MVVFFYLESVSFHRAEGILVKSSTSLRKLMGFMKATSMFQVYKKKDAQRAEELCLSTQERSVTHKCTNGFGFVKKHDSKGSVSFSGFWRKWKLRLLTLNLSRLWNITASWHRNQSKKHQTTEDVFTLVYLPHVPEGGKTSWPSSFQVAGAMFYTTQCHRCCTLIGAGGHTRDLLFCVARYKE